MARAARKAGLALGGEDDEEAEAEADADACVVCEADEAAPSRSVAVACIIN